LGELRVIGSTPIVMVGDVIQGELRVKWRTERAEEVTFAAETFQQYIVKGWLAIGEQGGTKRQIFTFNPELDRITLSPIMVGG
jgi:hypothetical protein